MEELLSYLTVYYECTAMAEAAELSQSGRFACNETYQQIKRLFLGADKTQILTHEQNVEAFRLFKAWEADNPILRQELKEQ